MYLDARDAPAVHPDKLLVCDLFATFAIKASSGLHNYFLSGCLIKPVAGHFFVAAPAVSKDTTVLKSLWQFVKQVYIPI